MRYIFKNININNTFDLLNYKKNNNNEFINLYINNSFNFNKYKDKNKDKETINYNKFIEFLKNNYNINSLVLYSKDLKSNFYIFVNCLINSNISNLYLYNLIFDDFNDISMLFEILKFNTYLTNLDLVNMNITNNNITLLYDGLLKNNTLTHLNLSYNSINGEGLLILGQILEENNTITTLNLSNNNIKNNNIYFDIFCENLIENKSLTDLNLSNNFMDENNIKSLSKLLKYNNYIVNLNLENTNIKNNIKYLEINNNLLSLNICNNNIINFNDLNNLLNQLEYNTSLFSFNISDNFKLHPDDIFHTYQLENKRRIYHYNLLIQKLDFILNKNIFLIDVLY